MFILYYFILDCSLQPNDMIPSVVIWFFSKVIQPSLGLKEIFSILVKIEVEQYCISCIFRLSAHSHNTHRAHTPTQGRQMKQCWISYIKSKNSKKSPSNKLLLCRNLLWRLWILLFPKKWRENRQQKENRIYCRHPEFFKNQFCSMKRVRCGEQDQPHENGADERPKLR
jgi:hypothetical protein